MSLSSTVERRDFSWFATRSPLRHCALCADFGTDGIEAPKPPSMKSGSSISSDARDNKNKAFPAPETLPTSIQAGCELESPDSGTRRVGGNKSASNSPGGESFPPSVKLSTPAVSSKNQAQSSSPTSAPTSTLAIEIQAGAKIDNALRGALMAKRFGGREQRTEIATDVKAAGEDAGIRSATLSANTGRGGDAGRGAGPGRGAGRGAGHGCPLKLRDGKCLAGLPLHRRLGIELTSLLRSVGGKMLLHSVAAQYKTYFGRQMKLEGYKVSGCLV